jgi:hypothetical protein
MDIRYIPTDTLILSLSFPLIHAKKIYALLNCAGGVGFLSIYEEGGESKLLLSENNMTCWDRVASSKTVPMPKRNRATVSERKRETGTRKSPQREPKKRLRKLEQVQLTWTRSGDCSCCSLVLMRVRILHITSQSYVMCLGDCKAIAESTSASSV